jgi:catechol 2,3-dioxygenase-like lactoylglutathione lyase family enzyme
MDDGQEIRTPGLLGSINHVAISVSDLRLAMQFFGPLLEQLGYDVGEIFRSRTGAELTVNINRTNGTGLNIWQAAPALAGRLHEIYAPGFHHLAFNVEKREQVKAIRALLQTLNAEILEGPDEYPFGPGGYFAIYFLGPDRLKLEIVHMPLAEERHLALTRAAIGAH